MSSRLTRSLNKYLFPREVWFPTSLLSVYTSNQTSHNLFDQTIGSNIPDQAQYKIISSHFHENVGSSISFTSDPRIVSKLTITRNQITSCNNQEKEPRPSILISVKNRDKIEISNNFIHNNSQGGIHINGDSSDIQCTIINNIISSNINGSESILLHAPDVTSPYVRIAGNELSRNNLSRFTDVIYIKNFRADIIRNIFSENFMRYVLNWDTSYNGNETGICENNTFFMNTGHLQTIVLKGSKKIIHRNFIVNPGNYPEILVIPNYPVRSTSEQFDLRFNWWGYGTRENILRRLQNSNSSTRFPVISYEPLIANPATIANRGRCTLLLINES